MATLVGAVLNFTPLDPIKALFWSAVIWPIACLREAISMIITMIGTPVEIVLGDASIRVVKGVDTATLSRVLAAVRAGGA